MDKRRMCPQCRAFITTDDKICPYCDTKVEARAVERRAPSDALGGLIPQARFTTIVLLLINTGFYIATLLYTQRTTGQSSFDPDSRTLFYFGAKQPQAIMAGQWWRFITAGFLHGGILHILMNMWVLFDLGAQVEEICGTSRFLTIYLFTNITGFYASYMFSPALSIGASAAIFGLIGGMIGVGVRDRTSFGAAIRKFFTRWAIYGLVLSLIPGIDIAAHGGGLAGGFLIGFIAGTPSYSPSTERVWKIAAGVMLAITGLAFFDMVSFMLRAT
jgi:rhomboid protease GluP